MNNDFDAIFEQWMRTKRFTSDPVVLAKIREYVEAILDAEGGYLSVSHFERAYLVLHRAGEIPEFREAAPAPDADSVPADVATFIRTAPVDEVRRKYNSDQRFCKHYDAFNSGAVPEVASRNLTAEEYNKLGSSEVIRRYRTEPTFKAAVDNLIAQGLI